MKLSGSAMETRWTDVVAPLPPAPVADYVPQFYSNLPALYSGSLARVYRPSRHRFLSLLEKKKKET